jgi:hypothetical protein
MTRSARRGGHENHDGDQMRNYQYFIYKIGSRPGAEGEYVGPFASEEERDEEAKRLRNANQGRDRTVCVYRANVEEGLASGLRSPSIVAA